MSSEFQRLCKTAGIIPVIEIDDAGIAADLAGALADGGLGVVELTLRTPAALGAMQAMKAADDNLVVGMGTILTADDARRAADHGAGFLVSPGFTPALAQVAQELALPFLPGVATPRDVMMTRDCGFEFLKFFPASAAGGAAYVKALGGPFADVVFCPTGGIGVEQAADYLALDNVVCVGGSWVAPRAMIRARQWDAIKRNAQTAHSISA